MTQPDEEYLPYRVSRPHWTSWFVPSMCLTMTAIVFVSNTIWGASAAHAQVAQLAETVAAHTKQLSVVQDEVSQEHTENAVILEKVANMEKTLERIETDVKGEKQK